MRLLRCRALLLGAILLGFTSSLAAQATMTGIVREDSSARALEGVEVLVSGTAHRTMTGANGRYLLEGLPAGIYQVIFRAVGHIPVRIDVRLTAGETTRANATLVRSDVVLDPIVVTGEPLGEVGLAGRGFEERRKMGFGRFVDEAEMRRSEHLNLDDLLRRHQVAVKPVTDGSITRWIALNSYRLNASGQPYCLMSIYLDGVLVAPGGSTGGGGRELEFYDLRRLIRPTNLVAAEVYRSAAQVPIQFGGARASCGVIVLWTRRG